MAADILFVVAEKLGALLHSEVSNLSTAYSSIKWMETELRKVHELLTEDPGLETNHKDLRKWVRNLTDAARNIEDIVDNFDFDLERRQWRMGCMGRSISTLKGSVAPYKIVVEIEQMKEKMGRICESMPNKQVFGFDKDFDALVKLLVDGNDPHPLYMSIVGPSGAGKTTLVKEVYDSDAVKKQFPFRLWLCGEEYKSSTRAFLMKISKKVTGSALQEVEFISYILQGRRYLIVLDINLIYDRNFYTREEFISLIRKAFPDDRNGSRVVVTCIDKKAADLFGQEIEVHELGMLSSEEKWKLFLNTWDFDAATAGTSMSSDMLEEIVRKQLHLPSEIVNLEALLSKENRKSCALSNIMLDHPNYYQVDGPQPTIASNFNILEPPLKLCFLYCSLFPKGFEIPKRRLMRLWLVDGFFQSARGWLAEYESLGGYRLQRLSDLGMIQVEYSHSQEGCESRERSERIKIRLESPVWDFAAMKAMQYNLCQNIDDERSLNSSNVRRLSLNSIGIDHPIFHQKNLSFDRKFSVSNVRSLLCFPQLTAIGGEVTFPMSRFKILRVLDLEDMYFITQLSEEIGELVHLRYLGLRRTGLYSLPNSIRKLKCLQSLDLTNTCIDSLPKSIGKLKYLQRLDLTNTCIDSLPNFIVNLRNLQSLDLRNTCIDGLPNSIGNLQILKSLDIRGTRVKPIPTAIQKLERLEYLYMDMDDGSTDDNDSLDVSSLGRLRVLSVIRVGRWMENGLGKLHDLTKLGIYGDFYDYQHIRRELNMTRLGSLRLGFGFGDKIPEDILLSDPWYLKSISSLYLERPLQTMPVPDIFPHHLPQYLRKNMPVPDIFPQYLRKKMPVPDKFPHYLPQYLRKLCLKWSLLEQDPMKTLEQLNYLLVLKLRCGSFLGKKMVCSANGFPELIFLELSLLDGLEEWTVEKGAMPKLKHLVIRLCNRLKELPQGLMHLQFIERLEVAGMPDTFNARLQYNKGEDWDKIKHIKSVTVDGIPMGASSSSSSYSSSSFQPY